MLANTTLVNKLNLMLATGSLVDKLYLMLSTCLTDQLYLMLPSGLVDKLYLLNLAWYHAQLLGVDNLSYSTIGYTRSVGHVGLQIGQGHRNHLLGRGSVVRLGHHQTCQQGGVGRGSGWGSQVS